MCSYATSKRRLVGGGWPRLSRAAFPRERKSCFWNAFGHREGRACAPQRQPSFAIVSEIAIGGVDGRLQGTSHDIIRRDKVRIYTVSCATRRSMSRQGKEEWQKTKQRRFPFLLRWSLSLSFSLFLFFSFFILLSLLHVIIIFLWAFLGRPPRHFSLGGFSHDWWAFVTILRSQSLSSLLHDGMLAASYCARPIHSLHPQSWRDSVRETREKLWTLWWAAGGSNNGTSGTQSFAILRLWKTALVMEHLSCRQWNWKFQPLQTGISQLWFFRSVNVPQDMMNQRVMNWRYAQICTSMRRRTFMLYWRLNWFLNECCV